MPSITSGPGVLDWAVYAGDRNEERFELTAAGAPWDLTGAVLTAQVRASATDPLAVLDAVCTLVDAVGGVLTVAWDGEEVRALLADQATWTGVWDLQVLEQGRTLPVTLVAGAWSARMDVTRP